ncbi:MAG: hypothetical protein DRN04_04390 [Thermoprotei archaeon]|nr:MAG: hypothetical protein DRN04_04390 [Thermoprotei archaeon]
MEKNNVWRWKKSQLDRPVVKGRSSEFISELADHEVHSDVIVAGRTYNEDVFFPSMVRLHTGELMVVYRAALSHAPHTPGRIMCVRSWDDGKSWSKPEVIIDTPYDDRDPHIAQLSDGTLVLTFDVVEPKHKPNWCYVYISFSYDNGRTWTKPRKVLDKYYATSEKVLELPDGRLLLPVYRPRDPTRRHKGVNKWDYMRYLAEVEAGREKRPPDEIFTLENPFVSVLLVSEDRGKTWREQCIIAEEINGKAIGFNETALAYLGGDHIVAVMRTDAPWANACIAHSFDGGESFEDPRMLPVNAHAPHMLVLNKTKTLLIYGNCDYSGGYVTRYVEVMVGDPRKDFKDAAPKIIYTGSGGDTSYPDAVLLKKDIIFAVYYDSGVGIIGGRFLKLSDLL